MMAASTLTIDLPCSEPPPIPRAAPRARRRSRPATLAAGQRIGVWRVERELGRGGMATVYAVVHTRFGKRAALKLAHRAVLGPRFTPETFLREARTANLIDHAGIADVFATGTFDGRPYLVMERLTGQSLGARLDDGALDRASALEILIELCDVLGAAHAAGVTHRDLKLDNVFLLDGWGTPPVSAAEGRRGPIDGPGADGRRTKLLDWGMARIAGEADPLRGLIAGTLTYLAPEQARGDDITPAADIYALGVVAYQLLLGAPPFAAREDLALIDKHLHDRPPRPRSLWSAMPAELDAVMTAMLAKQPADRPTAADVAHALREARRRIRPSRLYGLVAPPIAPADPLGRPVPMLLGGKRRIAGAVLGVALTVLGVAQLLIA